MVQMGREGDQDNGNYSVCESLLQQHIVSRPRGTGKDAKITAQKYGPGAGPGGTGGARGAPRTRDIPRH